VTIGKGRQWGQQVERPANLVMLDGDRAIAAALRPDDGTHPGPVAPRSGDLARTLGVTSFRQRTTMNALPIDLVEVRLDAALQPVIACAHVIARMPSVLGHGWRGPLLAVMNAEFIGTWDVAPRGHPNDGRVEVIEVDAAMTVRERWAARRRLATANHVPHPRITTRSVREATWKFPRPLEVIVDGRRIGRASTLAVVVIADAATVYA